MAGAGGGGGGGGLEAFGPSARVHIGARQSWPVPGRRRASHEAGADAGEATGKHRGAGAGWRDGSGGGGAWSLLLFRAGYGHVISGEAPVVAGCLRR